MEDALEGALHFDGKFFKSARYIFTRPGFLTTEFMAGRRARYMHPVRFYVFASFLFFAVCVLTGRRPASEGSPIPNAVALRNPSEPDATARVEKTKLEGNLESENVVGSSVRAESGKQSWLDDPLRMKFDSKDKVIEKDLYDEIWHLMPAMLILCLPLLALVLKLVYFRSGLPYLEHLIFALNIQTLAFLSFILIKAAGALGSLVSKDFESVFGIILLLGMFYLVYCAFRAVYHQGLGKTAFKFMVILLGYGLILIFALMGIVTASGYLVSRSAQ
jgi:hypothetical protein